MGTILETPDFPDTVYQIEEADPLHGGPVDRENDLGKLNWAAKDLADRTRWLYEAIGGQADFWNVLQAALAGKLGKTETAANALLLGGVSPSVFARLDQAALFEGAVRGETVQIHANAGNPALRFMTDEGNYRSIVYNQTTNRFTAQDENGDFGVIYTSQTDGPGSGLNADKLHDKTLPEIMSDVDALVNGLVDGAPGALNTLNELAAAMGDDPNFAATITNALAGKLSASGTAVNSSALGGHAANKYVRADIASTISATLTVQRLDVEATSGANPSIRFYSEDLDTTRGVFWNDALKAFTAQDESGAHRVLMLDGLHSNQYVRKDRPLGGVTSTIFAEGVIANYGDLVSGGDLMLSSTQSNPDTGTTLSGTWRCTGRATSSTHVTTFEKVL